MREPSGENTGLIFRRASLVSGVGSPSGRSFTWIWPGPVNVLLTSNEGEHLAIRRERGGCCRVGKVRELYPIGTRRRQWVASPQTQDDGENQKENDSDRQPNRKPAVS